MNARFFTALLGATALWMGGAACNNDRADRTESRAERGAENAALTTSVKAKLAADVRLGTLTSINVDSQGSTVTLSGTVRSGDEKRWAEEVAQSVDGVARVVNRLEVKS